MVDNGDDNDDANEDVLEAIEDLEDGVSDLKEAIEDHPDASIRASLSGELTKLTDAFRNMKAAVGTGRR
jgi:hypothetical protein